MVDLGTYEGQLAEGLKQIRVDADWHSRAASVSRI